MSDSAQKKPGEKLKAAREKIRLTQAEVAKEVNMTSNYYAMIERGEVNLSYEKIRKLLKLLNLDANELPL